jgi:hypothetical protein
MEVDCVTKERVDRRWMGLSLQKVPIFLSCTTTSLLFRSDIVYRDLGLCIQDICGGIPSPIEGFKPWHIGRLVDMLMYLQLRRQRASSLHNNIHGYYPSFRALVISAKHSNATSSPSRTTEGESLRRWTLLRALWDLLGRLFVWEDANLKSVGGGSGLLSTTQSHDSMHSDLVIDWKSTAFPLAITSWVKHSLPFSVRSSFLVSIY